MATTNPTYKPSESKREEFRKYLEKTGVMDGLTKVLVNLYEEPDKPADALQYIQDKLAVQSGNETLGALKAQLLEAQEKINQLELEKLQISGEAAPEEGGEVVNPEVPPEEEPVVVADPPAE